MIDYHSQIGNAAYIDLLRSLRDSQAVELIGTPIFQTRGGRGYVYDEYRVGKDKKRRYIGEDTPELREMLDRAGELKAREKERQAERTRLVRVLRAESYAGVDGGTGALLANLARIGVFRLGGTVVGTIAFLLYEGVLGIRLAADGLARTDDLDIASFRKLSLMLDDRVTEPIADALADLSFAPVPGMDADKVWKWSQTKRETLVEFLTPAFGDERVRDLPALGVSAQALNHLNFLIAEPIHAVVLYRSGVLVQVPRPERYAVHKMIVAERRRAGVDSLKSRKDRRQAELLIAALAEDRPDDLVEAWKAAWAEGPKWRDRMRKSLARMPDAAGPVAALNLPS